MTLFFCCYPKAFLEFDGLFKILPIGVLNMDEPIVNNLVDQLGNFHKELKESQAVADDSENLLDANQRPRKKRKKNSSKAIIHDEADEDNGSCSE